MASWSIQGSAALRVRSGSDQSERDRAGLPDVVGRAGMRKPTPTEEAQVLQIRTLTACSDLMRSRFLDCAGVSVRTHIRSAVAQYMRAHKPIVESPNALGFKLETPA